MARIRTIKPDFWSDEAVTECSFSARLLFIGTWNFADDSGNLDCSIKQLKMKIFPADNIKIDPLVQELITHGLLIEYSFDGKTYLHIKGFEKHQVINRPSPPMYPKYNDSLRTHGVLTPEGKGREGKGKERKGMSSEEVSAVLEITNSVLGKKFSGSKEAVANITKRINEGRTLEDFKTVCTNMRIAWGNDVKMSQYLCPETLYGEKFDKYLNTLPVEFKAEATRRIEQSMLMGVTF